MCYTGICLFENGGGMAGECMVSNHARFEEMYSETPCIVGRCPGDPDDERYIEAHEEHFDQIYCRWMKERHRS